MENERASEASTSPSTAGHEPSATSSAAKRFQVPRACARCRRLRRACSEDRPCVRCIDAGLSAECRASASATVPWSVGQLAQQRLVELVSAELVEYCAKRFFQELYPTIPVLTPDYIVRLQAQASPRSHGVEALCLLAAMCCQILLQVEEPNQVCKHGPLCEANEIVGRKLLDATLAARQHLARSPAVSFEQCLLAFFLYACQAALCHHSQAFIHLREATSLLLLFRNQAQHRSLLSDRLFWVLLVSERSHAIRYQRPITLQITAESPKIDPHDRDLMGFWSLAALFRPVNSFFIALLNHEELAVQPAAEVLAYAETAINSAIKPTTQLHDSQKANLRVTQFWLKIILWQLRLHLGMLAEESFQRSLTFIYPIDVAKDLTLSTRDLSIGSFHVHGVGLAEKLFDIASALIDVLARIPRTDTSPESYATGTQPEDDLAYIRALINKLPGGRSTYNDLLNRHIAQAGIVQVSTPI